MKTIYYFTAEWCQPCKQTKPIVEEINREQTVVHFQMIDIDDNIDLVERFSVKAVPTFILFEDGVEKNRIVGGQTREKLEKFAGGLND
jgi:thioredoxin 1